MTHAQALSLLPATLVIHAHRVGMKWGEHEAELWLDQRPEAISLPAWTMGTYAGSLSHVPETLIDAYETALDCAARDAFEHYDVADYLRRNPCR